MHSKKIQRQLKRAFGVNEIGDLVADLRALALNAPADPDRAKVLAEFLDNIPKLLDNVDRSYGEFEDRLTVASRNIDISSTELGRARDAVTAMVDSLTEGYVVVSRQGICDRVSSRVSTEIFEASPAGRHLFDILKLESEAREEAGGWFDLAFADRLGAAELNELGPRSFVNSSGHTYRLSYGLIRQAGEVTGLILIAADVTGEIVAQRAADRQVEEARLLTKLVENKDAFQTYVRFSREVLDRAQEMTQLTGADRDQFKFDLHTLKGGAATFYLNDVEATIHQIELDLRARPDADISFVREGAARVRANLEKVIDRHRHVLGGGEDWLDLLTLRKGSVLALIEKATVAQVPTWFLDELSAEINGIDVIQSLQSFASTIAVAAGRLGKEVDFEVKGESLRVPLQTYQRLFAAMVHVFRNAVDHGVEDPDDRAAHGKSRRARITVTAGSNPTGWWITIADDGRGMDVGRVRARLVEVGRTDAVTLGDDEVLNLLFESSVSTKSEVSTTSGLGVGLTALGVVLDQLGAERRVESRVGEGTTMTFKFTRAQAPPLAKVRPEPARPARDHDLNFRYNEMISEIAEMIRETRERDRLDQEILVARAVQKTLLPAESADYGDFNVSGRSFVAGSCGGDWWYHARHGDVMVVWIGDVLGHGIASALVASACRATAGALHMKNFELPVDQYLAVMNDVVFSMTNGEIYVTGVCMKIDLRTGDVEMASASHPAAVLVGEARGQARLLPTPLSAPLGSRAGETYVTTHARIEAGEGLFLMTDGLLDMNVRAGVRWSLPRILTFLNRALTEHRSGSGLTGAVEAFMFESASGEMVDDTTFVTVHRAALELKKTG